MDLFLICSKSCSWYSVRHLALTSTCKATNTMPLLPLSGTSAINNWNNRQNREVIAAPISRSVSLSAQPKPNSWKPAQPPNNREKTIPANVARGPIGKINQSTKPRAINITTCLAYLAMFSSFANANSSPIPSE